MINDLWQDTRDGEVVKMINDTDGVVIVASSRHNIDREVRGVDYIIRGFDPLEDQGWISINKSMGFSKLYGKLTNG